MEEIKAVDSLILSQKIIHRGLFFKLLKDGGELTMDDNKRGIRILVQGDFVNVQYIAYAQEPKFKTQVYKTMEEQRKKFNLIKEKQENALKTLKEKQNTLTIPKKEEVQTTINEGGLLW